MQMWNNQYSSGKELTTSICKDDKVMINNFESAHRLLNHGVENLNIKYPTFRDKVDLFFIDFDWIPLLIQESYLGSFEKRDSLRDVETMATASEFISLGDELNRQLRIK